MNPYRKITFQNGSVEPTTDRCHIFDYAASQLNTNSHQKHYEAQILEHTVYCFLLLHFVRNFGLNLTKKKKYMKARCLLQS